MPDRVNQGTIHEVVAEALRDSSDLARKEWALYRPGRWLVHHVPTCIL